VYATTVLRGLGPDGGKAGQGPPDARRAKGPHLPLRFPQARPCLDALQKLKFIFRPMHEE
jgi:hypothetical protein